jgi:hypothetical protein
MLIQGATLILESRVEIVTNGFGQANVLGLTLCSLANV